MCTIVGYSIKVILTGVLALLVGLFLKRLGQVFISVLGPILFLECSTHRSPRRAFTEVFSEVRFMVVCCAETVFHH